MCVCGGEIGAFPCMGVLKKKKVGVMLACSRADLELRVLPPSAPNEG